jgi:uncharacterized iron-regulated membrane protein
MNLVEMKKEKPKKKFWSKFNSATGQVITILVAGCAASGLAWVIVWFWTSIVGMVN